jgi:hypothetical protein
MKWQSTLITAGLLAAGMAIAPARTSESAATTRRAPDAARLREKLSLRAVAMHVRMQAVVLSDDDGSNPGGVLSVEQLRQWIDQANRSYRASHANVSLEFDPARDLAHVNNSCLNRLDHDQNDRAAALAAQYPGKMVVLFRAYIPKKGSGCKGNSGLTGNGYTAYNSYVPLHSNGCRDRGGKACSASYVVIPSVFCAATVGTDALDREHPDPPLGKDHSGCNLRTGKTYVYQDYSILAHEVGHYFGLPHTFPGASDFMVKPRDLQSWYNGPPRAGTVRSIRLFDGDSPRGPKNDFGYAGWTFTVTDTRPEVGAAIFVANGLNMCRTQDKTIDDGSGATVTFHGARYTFRGSGPDRKPLALTFTPDKGNLMSYFFCKDPMTLSPGQVRTMRNNLLDTPGLSYLLCAEANDPAIRRYVGCGPAHPPRRPARPGNGA